MPYTDKECEKCGAIMKDVHTAKKWCGDCTTIDCAQCGKSFTVEPWQAENRKHCSPECRSAAQPDKVQLTCEHCCNDFELPPSQAKGRKHCSPECQHEAQKERVEVSCQNCGTDFKVKASHASERRHCSRECMGETRSANINGSDHPNWKGGYEEYYGENWQEMRQAVRNRDCFRCRKCGMHEDECDTELHVHHIVPLREFDEPEEANTPSNLVTVCTACHNEVEGDVEAGRSLL